MDNQNKTKTQHRKLNINLKENRRGNQEWTIQRNRKHCIQDTERRQTKQQQKTKQKHNAEN